MILEGLSPEQKLELIELLEEKKRRELYRAFTKYFPDDGPLRRELYPKHMEFLAASKEHREICFLAANRIGKTLLGAYMLTIWMTGIYPSWWTGKKFDGPVDVWAAGKTNITVRDIIQHTLLGPPNAIGTGMIPGELIEGKPRSKPGVPDAVESFQVRSRFGGLSSCGFKSYEAGRGSFEGTARHVIWLDEEDEKEGLGIYAECLLRTMTTNGLVMCTFTPLAGMSDMVMHFLEGGRLPEDQSKEVQNV